MQLLKLAMVNQVQLRKSDAGAVAVAARPTSQRTMGQSLLKPMLLPSTVESELRASPARPRTRRQSLLGLMASRLVPMLQTRSFHQAALEAPPT